MPNYTPFLLLFLIYVIAGYATDAKWICICKEAKNEYSGQGVLLIISYLPMAFLPGNAKNRYHAQYNLFEDIILCQPHTIIDL